MRNMKFESRPTQKTCKTCSSPAADRRTECYACLYARRADGTLDASIRTVVETMTWTEPSDGGPGSWTKKKQYTRKAVAPASPPFRPAAAVTVTTKVVLPRKVRPAMGLVVALPDPQIGFRMTKAGAESFHDESAISCALSLLRALQPEVVVHLGDFLDLPLFSRFSQEPGFQGLVQDAIDRGHQFLAEVAFLVPGVKQYLLEGNHDARIRKTLAKLAPEMVALTPGGRASSWPAMSVPHLLGVEDLGVTYVDGYPAGRLVVGDVDIIHGFKINSSGSTAALVSKGALRSTLFGHVHRREMHTATLPDGKVIWAASPGTLARVDGAVPSFHSAISAQTGEHVPRYENWQQGVAVLTRHDKQHTELELVPIFEGRMIYRGREFTAGDPR